MNPFTVPERLGVAPKDAWPLSDEAFAAYLRSRRTLTAEDVEQAEREHGKVVGPWVANQIVHHNYGESRQ